MKQTCNQANRLASVHDCIPGQLFRRADALKLKSNRVFEYFVEPFVWAEYALHYHHRVSEQTNQQGIQQPMKQLNGLRFP